MIGKEHFSHWLTNVKLVGSLALFGHKHLVTARNEVGARLYFHRRL